MYDSSIKAKAREEQRICDNAGRKNKLELEDDLEIIKNSVRKRTKRKAEGSRKVLCTLFLTLGKRGTYERNLQIVSAGSALV